MIPTSVKEVDEPLDSKNILQTDDGKKYRIGGERMPLQENKVVNQNFYLLTLAVIAMEFDKRGISDGEVILALSGKGKDILSDEKKTEIAIIDEDSIQET